MSNKTQLQTNNTSLEALITRVNAAKDIAASLPEAGGTEDLDSVITELETKVVTLNNILEDKTSGAGSFETCTITINVTGDTSTIIEYIVATTVENGSLSQYSLLSSGNNVTSATIEHVLCGSAIFTKPIVVAPGWTISGEGLEVIEGSGRGVVLKAPMTAGTSASITFYETL